MNLVLKLFQSSFELTGYITTKIHSLKILQKKVSKLFRAYRLYNWLSLQVVKQIKIVSKLFRAYRLYNKLLKRPEEGKILKFQSSFELTGYITIFMKYDMEYVLKRFKALSSLQVI